MGVLNNLVPEKVFYYFEELCNIPHGSKNTKAISDYCVNFAKERGLAYHQDASNNIIILKNGSKGYEDSKPVIIQGHLAYAAGIRDTISLLQGMGMLNGTAAISKI